MSKIKTKITLGVLGTIVVGILTNALWDVLKPATKFLYEFILNVSILGIDKFKDSIYLDIAKGHHEVFSLKTYSLIIGVLMSFIVLSILITARRVLQENENHAVANAIYKFFTWPKLITAKSFLVFILIYTVFVVTIFSLNLAKDTYINDATTYYEQILSITAPYISSEEYLQTKSEFAQIKNKADYQSVIKKLELMASEHNLEIPKFSFVF